ncbi:MAG: riboflavin synthase subunit alpha, partial [Thermoanaerobaculia bacterium]|nr:riboflavin synthase subunit alpha [Thermoanaerobaculia bacterium]
MNPPMYTGIVQTACELAGVEERPGQRTLTVAMPDWLREGLAIGASVGLDGVCLTVTQIDNGSVSFDTIRETNERTTLGRVAAGDRVNVERSAVAGAEIGGHEISGHVDGTAEIVAIDEPEGNRILTFLVPADFMPYIFPKGFIALNGCSLTVVDVEREANTFTVHLIPETLRVTTFDEKKVGDRVNFEIERRTQVMVDT